MGHAEAHDPKVLRHYEGLIFTTAQLILARGVEGMDSEDVQQLLRIKLYRALLAYDPARSRMTRDGYVFMCLRDKRKDLENLKRYGEVFIEDVARPAASDGERLESHDAFDERYLSSSQEQVYGSVEDEGLHLPSTLTPPERALVQLLYRDYRQTEAGRLLGLDKREVEKLMRSIRLKMADWRPTPPTDIADPELPTPVAA